MFINHSSREVTAKVVYYGPGLSGKTTNLQYIFSVTSSKSRGELISIETEIERTLFFDLLPMNVGLINGYQAKFQLYTVPGQIFYDSTRKLVLKGADGVVFVADSQELMKQANVDSIENLKTNLGIHRLNIDEIPMVFQFNKRDLANTVPVEQLNKLLNTWDLPYFSAVATEGEGVLETLRGISTLILKRIKGLLEQPPDESEEISIPMVNFDTNKKQKMIEREKLPLRKIHTEDLEAVRHHMERRQEDMELKLFDEDAPADGDPDELKVETIDDMDEFMELDGLMLEEELDNIKPLDGLEEIKLEEDVTQGLENSSTEELVQVDIDADTNELINIKDVAEAMKKKVAEQPDADENLPDINEIQELNTAPGIKKDRPKINDKLKDLELFERLKDKTRETIIRDITVNEPPLLFEIKDKNGNLLESFPVTFNQETKKVNLIIDLNK